MNAMKPQVDDALDRIKQRMESVLGWDYFEHALQQDHLKKRLAAGGSFLLALAKAVGQEEIMALSGSVTSLEEVSTDFAISVDVATPSGILRASAAQLRDSEDPTEVEVLRWSQVRSMQVVSYENAWFEHNRSEQTSVIFHFSGDDPVRFVGQRYAPTSDDEVLALIAHVRSRLA